eukprot:g35293.t1
MGCFSTTGLTSGKTPQRQHHMRELKQHVSCKFTGQPLSPRPPPPRDSNGMRTLLARQHLLPIAGHCRVNHIAVGLESRVGQT